LLTVGPTDPSHERINTETVEDSRTDPPVHHLAEQTRTAALDRQAVVAASSTPTVVRPVAAVVHRHHSVAGHGVHHSSHEWLATATEEELDHHFPGEILAEETQATDPVPREDSETGQDLTVSVVPHSEHLHEIVHHFLRLGPTRGTVHHSHSEQLETVRHYH